jgi:hypothetical protein
MVMVLTHFLFSFALVFSLAFNKRLDDNRHMGNINTSELLASDVRNAQACANILGRSLTNREYIYIKLLNAQIHQAIADKAEEEQWLREWCARA